MSTSPASRRSKRTLWRHVTYSTTVLALFSSRMSRSRFNRAAENIAYGHADFASTLKQWTNSAGHRANLVLHGAKWIGVAHAQNGRQSIGQWSSAGK